ncbi:unconventional myosin-XVIIIa isoform X7 [Drosophila pseudoobscura]|uniref:Unconventional myosin-XVIIIa isoform X7 n=2 Tax=Drosophila pseudoobscura pseudoobscura TaxID=46245 RepID=A0A6I8V7C3_DROPS|nr:unconventional myosin-XVIIIa isoform X7 [Drosophila pseudoobscura]
MPPLSPANEANADIAAAADEEVPYPETQLRHPGHESPLESDRREKERFLERVLAAMNGTRGSGGGGTATISHNSSNSSLNSTLSGSTSVPLARPPKPPTSQARKQLRLLPKQREQSPVLSNGHGHTRHNTTSNTTSSTHTYNNYTSSKRGSSSSGGGSSLSTSLLGKDLNLKQEDSESHYEISLKLPFNQSSTAASQERERERDRVRLVNRSPSPAYSISSRSSAVSSSVSNCSRLQTPPRRVFPQSYTRDRSGGVDPYEMRQLESSPVVFDGNLSFVLGCQRQPVHQTMRASPSFEDPRTSSAYLSEKIKNFLKRTDHVQEEWTAMGRRTRRTTTTSRSSRGEGADSRCTTPGSTCSGYDDYDTISLIERQRERNSMERCGSVGRTRSSQNILTKAFQLAKQLPHTPTSRGNSQARERESSVASTSIATNGNDDDDDRTIHEEDDELSELTVDLAEERSTAHIATERLEAETGERLKLEKELGEQAGKVKNLQETTEKLEMELICAKSDLNGISEDEEGDNEEGSGGVYKLKYERVARELEFTKRRLQTQHEHDLEQLVGLKKQLEKKLSDAYEEVEEQRQVVGQWKRKAQKMTNEMNDLRMLLEEQNARNNLLEKKQRKFDAECQSLQDASRQERQAKERYGREKDVLQAEKFTLEQTLADTRLDLDLKEEKLASLQRELEEMTFGGSTEEEFAQLRRSKNETERRAKEQEEELDEMAGQIQLLEQAKLRLEMTLETMRKEARRESQQRDEELEEVRGNGYKKIKALECQLETEHEERTLLLREKHELERRLSSMEDRDRVDRDAEEALNQKLRRDLRKYKALLKDAQTQLERLKADTPGKTLIRQLRNQLEDAESARSLAMKARQTAEAELTEVQAMFEESHRARNDAEERANVAHRDRAELQAQIEENEEELSELMKKYSATVKQLNSEQINVSEAEFKLNEMEAERNNLKEQVGELQHRLDNVENLGDPSMAMMSKRLELRTKELESRLELEQATRARLEVQVNRHKEALEKLQNEVTQSKMREMQAQEMLKKSQKSLRDMREEYHTVSSREQESLTRRKDLEKKMEQMESEGAALKNDLRLALQRIADLQQAMEEEGEEELSESDESISSVGSISDLEDRLRPVHVKRSSQQSLNGGSLVGPSHTRTLVCEKDDNSPRITVTSPSSPHIHKMALAAKAIPATKPDTKLAEATATATTAAAATTIWRPKATSTPTTMTLRPVDVQQNGQKP